MRGSDLAVRVVRSLVVAIAVALVAMLAFSVLDAIGAVIAERSVAADDPNPYAVALVPIGTYAGIAAGVAALTWPAPRHVLGYGLAVGVRALALAALTGFLTAQLADLIPAVEPVLAWILAALMALLTVTAAWEYRPFPAADAPPPVRTKPTLPSETHKPESPTKVPASRKASRRA